MRHGESFKRCSHGGCTNQAVKGMAKIVQVAAMKDAPNNAQKEGLCMRYRANFQRSSHQGCTYNAVKRGACMRHGAESERTEHVVANGVPAVSSKEVYAIGMDARIKAYFHEVHGKEGCTTSAYKGGVLVGFVAIRRKD